MPTYLESRPLEILRRARARITDIFSWTRDTYARDVYGTPIDPDHTNAVQWCAVGAILAEQSSVDAYRAACAVLGAAVDRYKLPEWNDNSAHADVLRGFDRAIAMLEAQQ